MADAAEILAKKRRRGAQPGNMNARKHGFYARTMTALELADLEAATDTDLDDALALMKVLLRRVFEASKDETSGEALLAYLGGAGMAIMRIVALLKAKKMMGRDEDQHDLISKALSEVVQELQVKI